MTEQTPAGRARAAENRAAKLQRAAFRDAIKDPEARRELLGDPAFRELVQSEAAAELRRQQAEQERARAAEARQRALENAPRFRQQDVTGDFHKARVAAARALGDSAEVQRLEAVVIQATPGRDIFRGDPAHDPRVMSAMLEDAPPARVAQLVELVKKEQAEQHGDRAGREGFMWDTRSGQRLMSDSHKQFPGAGMGLPPQAGQQRSTPLPDQEKVRADREADS